LLGSTYQNSVIATQLPQKLTLEVVYGHAWALGKNLAKVQDDVAYIDLNQIGRKTRNDSA
jgi:malonyl-CoA O-methyltransferase